MPHVSIITALHNKGPYIAETIRSVLDQTLPDWEMIVVENGSIDNGPEIVRQFSDPRVRLVASSKQGPGAARNFGLSLATGEWVLFLDADDLIEADYLGGRFEALTQQPQANLLVGCWEEFLDGQPAKKTRHQPVGMGGSAQDIANAAIAYAPWILHAALIKRSLLQVKPEWPEHLDVLPHEDSAYWFPIVCEATPAWSEKGGALYRVNTADSRNEIINVEKTIKGVTGVVAENVKFLNSTGREPNSTQADNLMRTFESAYRTALKRHDRKMAEQALDQAAFWLEKTVGKSTSLWLRRWLGLRWFNLIRFGTI